MINSMGGGVVIASMYPAGRIFVKPIYCEYMVDGPVLVVAPEIVVWQKRSHNFPTPRN